VKEAMRACMGVKVKEAMGEGMGVGEWLFRPLAK
jgi:hypothetical protein